MELTVCQQLEGLSLEGPLQSHGAALTGSEHDSSSLASTSSPSDNVPYLPPELLSEIFEAVERHPSSDHRADLASLCLVNRLFLQLARPILYREVRLDVSEYCNKNSSTNQLGQTLLRHERCSKLVRGIRLDGDDGSKAAWQALEYLLVHIGQLEWIRTTWNSWIEREEAEEFVKSIVKHQPRLSSLSLANVALLSPEICLSILNMAELRSFVGILRFDPDKPIATFVPSVRAHLEQLFLTHPIGTTHFRHCFQASASSLTHLSLSVSPLHSEFDLSSFSKLAVVRLVIVMDPPDSTYPRSVNDTLRNEFGRALHATIASLGNLSGLETLSISAYFEPLTTHLFNHSILDLLPASLVYLDAVPLVLAASHFHLVEAIKNRSLPNLRCITVLPAENDEDETGPFSRRSQKDAALYLFECIDPAHEIEVAIVPGYNRRMPPSFAYDPELSETDYAYDEYYQDDYSATSSFGSSQEEEEEDEEDLAEYEQHLQRLMGWNRPEPKRREIWWDRRFREMRENQRMSREAQAIYEMEYSRDSEPESEGFYDDSD